MKNFDLALIEITPGCIVEFTEPGDAAVLENALMVDETNTLKMF